MREPRLPERTRLVRPDLFEREDSGQLPAEAFKLYIGLGTCCDDEGWTLWRTANIAARLYPYRTVARRQALVEREAQRLVACGLLVLHECGCAQLPHLHRDFRIAGGSQAKTVVAWHASHLNPDMYVHGGTSTAPDSVLDSVLVNGFAKSGGNSGAADEAGNGAEPGAAVDPASPYQLDGDGHIIGTKP